MPLSVKDLREILANNQVLLAKITAVTFEGGGREQSSPLRESGGLKQYYDEYRKLSPIIK